MSYLLRLEERVSRLAVIVQLIPYAVHWVLAENRDCICMSNSITKSHKQILHVYVFPRKTSLADFNWRNEHNDKY